ncbi:MAG: hypothetical protein LBU73_06490 [Helicobacteraceae bacterium]|nr:hypothetical protein [Helicobacteraceae bacterium]
MAKVAVLCGSPLLKKACENFLRSKLTPAQSSDLIVCDKAANVPANVKKPRLVIGEHIKKPFSREELLFAIAKFEKLDIIKTAASESVLGNKIAVETEKNVNELYLKFAEELLNILKNGIQNEK